MGDQTVDSFDQVLAAVLPEYARTMADLLNLIEHGGRALLLGVLIANRASGV